MALRVEILLTSIACLALTTGCAARKEALRLQAPAHIPFSGGTCDSPEAGPNIRVTNAIGDSNDPILVGNKEGFLVLWKDGVGQFPSTTAVNIDGEGVPLAEEIVMPQDGECSDQSAVYDGQGVHISWTDEGVLKSLRNLEDTEKINTYGSNVLYSSAGAFGAVTWIEDAVLYFRNDGMLPPPDRSGAREEPEPLVVARGGIETVSVAWTGEFYAIVWSQSVAGGRQIVMQRVTNRGLKLGPVVKVSATGGISRNPVVLWDGERFAIAWTNEAPGDENPNDKYRAFFAVVQKEASMPSLTKQLDFSGSADSISLASTGTEMGIAWVGSKKPAGSAVYFQRFTADGVAASEIIQVTDDEPVAVGRPSIAWGDGFYGVVWHDSRFYEGSEVFYSKIRCDGPETQSAEDMSAGSSDDTASEDETAEPPSGLKNVF